MAEKTPSENEWIIMEILWNQDTNLTAAEIIQKLKGIKDVSPKTIRVLINRLLKKGIIDYQVDAKDSRIYHYFPVKSKENCLAEKSEQFLNSYFGGNPMGMVATLVRHEHLSQEERNELIYILKEGQSKDR